MSYSPETSGPDALYQLFAERLERIKKLQTSNIPLTGLTYKPSSDTSFSPDAPLFPVTFVSSQPIEDHTWKIRGPLGAQTLFSENFISEALEVVIFSCFEQADNLGLEGDQQLSDEDARPLVPVSGALDHYFRTLFRTLTEIKLSCNNQQVLMLIDGKLGMLLEDFPQTRNEILNLLRRIYKEVDKSELNLILRSLFDRLLEIMDSDGEFSSAQTEMLYVLMMPTLSTYYQECWSLADDYESFWKIASGNLKALKSSFRESRSMVQNFEDYINNYLNHCLTKVLRQKKVRIDDAEKLEMYAEVIERSRMSYYRFLHEIAQYSKDDAEQYQERVSQRHGKLRQEIEELLMTFLDKKPL